MNKLWLIVKREYTTRVFKKSFILLTLLVPLAIVAFSVIVGFITKKSILNFVFILTKGWTSIRPRVSNLPCPGSSETTK